MVISKFPIFSMPLRNMQGWGQSLYELVGPNLLKMPHSAVRLAAKHRLLMQQSALLTSARWLEDFSCFFLPLK